MTNREYNIFKHRHNFAIWAAARASQRGLAKGSISTLKKAFESKKIRVQIEELMNKKNINKSYFDIWHKKCCNSFIEALEADVCISFGRAAKFIAIYLKVVVVLDDKHEKLAATIHPPIDSILLRNLQKVCKQKQPLLNVKWTNLNNKDYDCLICHLRKCIPDGEPFWKLEKYWTVTD